MQQAINVVFFIFPLLLFFFQLKCQSAFPFSIPEIVVEDRINNLLSLMTLDEIMACKSTKPDISGLGVEKTGHVEGFHGLAHLLTTFG